MQYRLSEKNFLGNKFNKEDIQPDDDKIKAIVKLEEPNNKSTRSTKQQKKFDDYDLSY